GNNGGDGLWTAVYLRERGAAVSCYCWHRPGATETEPGDDAPATAVRAAGIPLLEANADRGHAKLKRLLADAAVIVDALLGIGLTRPIGGDLAELIALARLGVDWRREQGPPPPIFAVDIPTGVDAD